MIRMFISTSSCTNDMNSSALFNGRQRPTNSSRPERLFPATQGQGHPRLSRRQRKAMERNSEMERL